MMTELIEIEKTALRLPPEERAILAQKLWESLEGFFSPEIENAWMNEANRRWREIENGKVRCIPAKTVMARARAALKKS